MSEDKFCPKCGIVRFYAKSDGSPAKFCCGCGHKFEDGEPDEPLIGGDPDV